MLENIKSPEDLKKIPNADLPELAQEIRDEIIRVTSINGGHTGPNLGVVELTIAMHRVFNTPKDRFLWDVSHQGYVHKLLTGRNGEYFEKLRKTDGPSGFLAINESEHDAYGAGHAGTALSAALGMAVGRDLRGGDEHVVSVLGDAAFTCGITLEAMNNISESTKKLIVILNDNEWSIAKNVGAMSQYLNDLITNPVYKKIHEDIKAFLKMFPGGDSIKQALKHAKMDAKDLFVPSSLFEHFGLRYIGPIDGHDITQLIEYLEFCSQSEEPILLHVLTQKGKGYDIAIENPEKFHGTGAFDVQTGKSEPKPDSPPKYQDVFGETLTRYAKEDEKVVGITAAMPSGTGLNIFANELPKQFFDVGIAEEHAVIFAAGLATQGFKPVCAIYSTFLQRAVDPIIHDIALQKLPVLFCMDRAGIAANDGPTHHGLFDIALFRSVPGTVIMQPMNEDELADMVYTGLKLDSPTFIRYPRGEGEGVKIKEDAEFLEPGKAETIQNGTDISIWALGPMVYDALKVAQQIEAEASLSVSVVNARYVKPFDRELLLENASRHQLLISLEDHAVTGGLGTTILETLQEANIHTAMERIGWPDDFISHATSVSDLRKTAKLSIQDIKHRILNRWKKEEQKSSEQNFEGTDSKYTV